MTRRPVPCLTAAEAEMWDLIARDLADPAVVEGWRIESNVRSIVAQAMKGEGR